MEEGGEGQIWICTRGVKSGAYYLGGGVSFEKFSFDVSESFEMDDVIMSAHRTGREATLSDILDTLAIAHDMCTRKQ